MKFRSLMTAICVLAAAQIVSAAPFAYIANSGNKTVSVIDTAITPTGDGSNAIINTVTLPGSAPDPYAYGITVGASGQYVYVGLQETNTVAVIDASTNSVVKSIALLTDVPSGLAVNAAETRLYVAINNSNVVRIIDISGTGASEVGRVTVSDSSQSVPEGVALNAAGTKAYVANSADGQDSIAEITLDEATNTYTRSSIIALPAGSKPYGLAINGTKLYFASFNGNAGVVDLSASPKTVTAMATALGNLSIAVNPATGNVYAPSNTMDQLFAFNAAGTSLGAPVTAGTGPRGVSVSPAGKLFVAMNLDEKVKIYDTANLANTPVSIALPAGTKPNSYGNFIGPVWDRTIVASATAPCTITPSGTVPVNSNGWTFSIAGSGCKVLVNGADVGYPTSYKIANVPITPVPTISASQVVGTYYPLNVSWTGVLGGFVVSNPVGITQGSNSASFQSGTVVTLKANNNYSVISWTGACLGQGQMCTLTMDAAKTVGATVALGGGGPVYNVTKASYYQSCAETTAAAATADVIKISTAISAATTTGTAGTQALFSSQWDQNDYTKTAAYAPLTLTITDVAVIVDTTAGYTLTL